jgi:tetratricopeptide (TPR) repeat protein
MRLDGWKLIAAHFGRERSTVIRWATERGMPVHRIPGPGRSSVYALTEELDAWLEADRATGDGPDDDSSVAPVGGPASGGLREEGRLARLRSRRVLAFVVPGAIAVASLSAWAINRDPPRQTDISLPASSEAAGLYLEARADWAARRPESIASAIAKLQQVVMLEPGFAPAYAALADSYVLAREFGSLEDVDAFARAQAAADAALRIDPENPDALRAAGFIEYWWRGDRAASARLFRASIVANPQAAQTRFWFGNVLVDNGDFAAGMAELERALLLEPASVPLQVDTAWARWSMGDEARGLAELERLRDANPSLATIHDYLAVIYLSRGDVAAFVAEATALAEVNGRPSDGDQAIRLQAALAADAASVAPMVLADLEADLASGRRSSLTWPTFVATAARDRVAVVRLLGTGKARGERWGSAGLMRHVRESWAGDSEITLLLDDLAADSLVAS